MGKWKQSDVVVTVFTNTLLVVDCHSGLVTVTSFPIIVLASDLVEGMTWIQSKSSLTVVGEEES